MTDEQKITAALKIAEQSENKEVARQKQPDKEHISAFQKQQEKEGRSEWSGGWAGGRTR